MLLSKILLEHFYSDISWQGRWARDDPAVIVLISLLIVAGRFYIYANISLKIFIKQNYSLVIFIWFKLPLPIGWPSALLTHIKSQILFLLLLLLLLLFIHSLFITEICTYSFSLFELFSGFCVWNFWSLVLSWAQFASM